MGRNRVELASERTRYGEGYLADEGALRFVRNIGLRLRRFLAVSAICLASSCCAIAGVRIGAVTCLTGALSTFGVSSIQGAKLAMKTSTAAGAFSASRLN